MIKTKVKYTKTKAVISMDKNKYRSLCDGYNKLRRAMNMIMETNDLYLSDVRNLENFSFTLKQELGFERGKTYWSDVTIPKEQNNEKTIQ
jgi:hypothetical protein